MSETNQERVERLIAERDTAVNQLAEWFVRTHEDYIPSINRIRERSGPEQHPYCIPYTIHELLDKAISDLKTKET
jgi:hypothetical protein